MGLLIGQVQYAKWKKKKKLTRGEAIRALCFMCNGEHKDDPVDCLGEKSCPMYQYFPSQYKTGREG